MVPAYITLFKVIYPHINFWEKLIAMIKNIWFPLLLVYMYSIIYVCTVQCSWFPNKPSRAPPWPFINSLMCTALQAWTKCENLLWEPGKIFKNITKLKTKFMKKRKKWNFFTLPSSVQKVIVSSLYWGLCWNYFDLEKSSEKGSLPTTGFRDWASWSHPLYYMSCFWNVLFWWS